MEPASEEHETAKAIGLAAATMAANLVAVVFTVIFTRVLGSGGYVSLAALLNLSVILFVPGSALQVAAAREGTLGRLRRGGELAGTLRRWTHPLPILPAAGAGGPAPAGDPPPPAGARGGGGRPGPTAGADRRGAQRRAGVGRRRRSRDR